MDVATETQDPWSKLKPRGNSLLIQTGVPVEMLPKLKFVGELLMESGAIKKHTVWGVASWCITSAIDLIYEDAMKRIEEEGGEVCQPMSST
jgi:hypothetical protein